MELPEKFLQGLETSWLPTWATPLSPGPSSRSPFSFLMHLQPRCSVLLLWPVHPRSHVASARAWPSAAGLAAEVTGAHSAFCGTGQGGSWEAVLLPPEDLLPVFEFTHSWVQGKSLLFILWWVIYLFIYFTHSKSIWGDPPQWPASCMLPPPCANHSEVSKAWHFYSPSKDAAQCFMSQGLILCVLKRVSCILWSDTFVLLLLFVWFFFFSP